MRPLNDDSQVRVLTMLLDHPREKFVVGATTFTLQVPTRTFGSAFLTRTPTPRPALQLSEIAFTVYYPTYAGLSTKKYQYLDWIVRWAPSVASHCLTELLELIVFFRPIGGSLAGIACFTGKHQHIGSNL